MGSIVGGIASIAGGIIGNIASGDDRDRAEAATQQALKEIQDIGAPPDMAREIFLKHFQSAGILTPEMQKNIDVQFDKVKPQTQGRDAQMSALKQFGELSKTGMGPQERLAYQQAQEQAARDNSAQQASIMQNMQARGQSGGGAELAQRLMASQSGANRLSSSANEQAAAAANRALQALSQYGNLGGQLQSQDTNLAAQNAGIANEQNRFNVANQLAIQQANVGAKNQAQASNLNTAQGLSNANTSMDNAEQLRRRQGEMETYNAKAQQAQRVAGMLTGQIAPMYNNKAQQTADMWKGLGKGVGEIAGSDAMSSLMGGGGTPGMDASNGPVGYGPTAPGAKTGLGSLAPLAMMALAHGGQIPGHAQHPGDTMENDTVHVALSPGEIVLPRSVAQDPEMAKNFVKHLLRK